jgi:DtxR family transcriptional regulator, Mn-dependent transcriptional regulator
MSLTLLIILSCLLLIIVAFPNYGLLSLMAKSRKENKKILIENALKHLYDREYKKINASVKSIATTLFVSVNKADSLVCVLQNQKLVTISGEMIALTDEGRDYALQIIRTHRLWERYLADETIVSESKWHKLAEKMEHVLNPDETEKLAARLGQPLFDPHGDPIPVAIGNLPEEKSMTVKDFHPGDKLKIVHVEDEPQSIYDSLIKKGLRAGSKLVLLKKLNDCVEILLNENLISLNFPEAENLNAVIDEHKEEIETKQKTLASLKIGEVAVIKSISKRCRGQQRRRLLDLGVIPGSIVTAEMISASGDPTAYKIKEALIALRKQQAETIYIEEPNEKESK